MVAFGGEIAAERGKLAGGDHVDGSGRIVGGKRDTKENGHDFVSLEKSPLSTPFSLELPRAADGRRRGYCPAARGGSMPPSAACLAKKGKRGPGGCRSLSRVNSGAALLTLRCRTLSLAVELHHVQRDRSEERRVGEEWGSARKCRGGGEN